jgi:hypothetical protein
MLDELFDVVIKQSKQIETEQKKELQKSVSMLTFLEMNF